MRDVAKSTVVRKIVARLHPCRTGALAALVAVSGCVGSGLGTASIDKPDTSIVTASIPAQRQIETDPVTVGDAVVTANPGIDQGIPWANPATGSAGVISYVEEIKAESFTCRKFETSRHSYDGIALFVGETCRAPGEGWRVMSFAPKSPAENMPGASES